MKKILILLLLITPFIGFGQNFLDTITINHKTNVLEISKKTELECEKMIGCDFGDWFGQSIRNIIGFETELYDELINEYYNTMKSVIPEEDFIQIRDSQRSWLKSRDNTEQFIFSTIQKDGWMMLDRLLLLNMYKNRVSELLEIFKLYSWRSGQDDYLINIQDKDFKSNWRDHE
tara:strand:+ start:679 stop:1200 length:522 start_codon:yes stop_codon:yes gene_type:complete